MSAPAIFLDRDGTLIEDVGYLADPDRVRVLPGVADAIKRFKSHGFRVVIVSNQSGIARGRFDEETLMSVHDRLDELLRREQAELDGAYYCPFLDSPDATVKRFRRNSELRKPKPGMLIRAAGELDLDLAGSWMIGDSAVDVEAGRRAGCRTIRVQSSDAHSRSDGKPADYTVTDLAAAAECVVAELARAEKPPAPAAGIPAVRDQAESNDAMLRTLQSIHHELERSNRNDRQHDFSMLRLLGALLQMFAVVVGMWGAFDVLGEQTGAGTPRLVLACLLQLGSLSAFAIDRFR